MGKDNTGIYLLNLQELLSGAECAALFESALGKADAVRREKALGVKNARGRAAGLGAGLLLQRAVQDFQGGGTKDRPQKGGRYTVSGLLSELGQPLPLTYRYGERGKPYFEDLPLYFNLSHSGDYVLCAVSDVEVGVDIQKIQPVNERKLAKRFFSEAECRVLEGCESSEGRRRLFFELWSRKEAYGKLTGEGIAAVIGRDMREEAADWQEVAAPEGYAAAVCT